jgi:hypothetical protein
MIATFSYAQSNMRMEFFPGNEIFSASANVYSTSDASLSQYYMNDGEWTINPNVGSPNISVNGGNYRMQYSSQSATYSANLFIYSCKSGEFEFMTLENSEWVPNNLLKSGKANFSSSDIRMVFHPATASAAAFISAHSTNGKEISILQMIDGEWMALDYFPRKVK